MPFASLAALSKSVLIALMKSVLLAPPQISIMSFRAKAVILARSPRKGIYERFRFAFFAKFNRTGSAKILIKSDLFILAEARAKLSFDLGFEVA